jgi:flagellar biosynthesis protein FlhF
MMKIKKFTAASIPEALNIIRDEMGEDALILGTSRTRGRKGRSGTVEVVAARSNRSPEAEAKTHQRPERIPGDPIAKEIKEMRKLDRDIVSELKQIETRLKDLLEGLNVQMPAARDAIGPVNKDILSAGFDPGMLEGKVPASLLRSSADSDQIVRALVGGIALRSLKERIIVFLGPSGSGKTTTLLKVARAALENHETRPKVVFFGAKDNDTSWLKSRCKRLGLKFMRVDRVDSMAKMLKKERSPILIDTAGISDLGEAELRFLVEAAKTVEGMGLRLVVDATMDPWNACAIASCIPEASGLSLVFTKLDEATRIGGAVSASIASGIPVALVTGGRAVEDGVHVPDAELLSEKIMDGIKASIIEEAGRRA